MDQLHRRAVALVAESAIGAVPRLPENAGFVSNADLNVELFFRYVSSGIEPTEEETRPLTERAVRLVLDGMPVAEAMANFRLGDGQIWEQVMRLLEDSERALAPELATRLSRYLSLIMSRVAQALVEEARQPNWEAYERRRDVGDDLLNGRDPVEWDSAPDVAALADSYFVGALRLGAPAPGTLTDLRDRVTSIPGSVLHRHDGAWAVLIPILPGGGTNPAAEVLERLGYPPAPPRRPSEYWIGLATAPNRSAIPAAYYEAKIVANVASCLRRPEIISQHQDLILEYAIATTELNARAAMAAVLDPLDDQPVLAHTLDALIDNHFDTNAVARELYVHRNTVTYRLSRIADLTGYDPQHPAGVSTLIGASIARKLVRADFNS